MSCRWTMLGILALLAVAPCAGAAEPPRARLVATGWDSPTPAQFRTHLAAFEQWPFDGTMIFPTRRLADGKVVDAKNAFGKGRWTAAEFEPAVADLRAAKPTRATHNFLVIYANPGDVDWFDDAGWQDVIEHARLLAATAKAGGLKGLLFDAEPYTEPHRQFHYASQPGRDQHTFAEYAARARERGRDFMKAVAGEFPDITLFTYRLLCDLIPLTAGGDAAPRLAGHVYGLLPAFVDGWFDVLPPTARIVEGNENAYRYNSEAAFDRAYVDLRVRVPVLLDPAHQAKYRSQLLVGHGIYLDAHANPPTSPWYIDPRGGPRAARLEVNVASALRASDGYVWIYGETARWWPSGNPRFPLWPEKLPGADRALARARDPVGAARARLAAARPEEQKLKSGDFAAAGTNGLPRDWWFWQNDDSRGRPSHDGAAGHAAPGAGRLAGVSNGCLGQNVAVQPGEGYAVGAWARREGQGHAGVTVRWKDDRGRWTAEDQDVALAPAAGSGGWTEFAGLVRVPELARELVLLLSVQGQRGPDDRAWFDDARVVSAEP